MGGGQVCLKWNSFHSSLASGFKTLWEEDGLVDVTLASDGRCIQAHKLILSACSPFFRDVFKANPCQHPVIILQDTHFSELESLLCFVYKGEVNIEQENLPALLRAAETLQIRGLAGASEQVQNELGGVTSETEEIAMDESPLPSKRAKDDNWRSASSSSWQPHYSRTKKRSGSRSSSRNTPISVEAVLETTLSPERVPKLEPVDHDLEADGDVTPILPDSVDEPADSDAALFLGPEMNIAHVSPSDIVAASDTGQNNDEPFHQLEQNLQSLECNQVFNCLTSSRKDNPFPPFPCPFCVRAYTSWGFRRRHIKAMHTHSERLICKWCLQVMETHVIWKKHVSSIHGLSPTDAQNGILILEEANMVLRIPNPPRLETVVSMLKSSASGNTGTYIQEHRKVIDPLELHRKGSASATRPSEQSVEVQCNHEKRYEDSKEKRNLQAKGVDDKVTDIKVERPSTPE